MKVQFPLVFDVVVDEAALQDLVIDFCSFGEQHLRGIDWLHGFPSVSDEALKAFSLKLGAREALWKLFECGVTLPPQTPTRLKPLVCACALCQLFGVSAKVSRATLDTSGGSDARWDIEICLTDKQGKLLSNRFAISEPFPPDDYHKSLAAFFGAAVDGVRECALVAFLASEARDDQDIR